MNRKSSNRRNGARGTQGRRRVKAATAGGDPAHSLESQSNFRIADDGQVDVECLSARQRIEEYEARRRLWARVHWLDAFEVAPRS